MQHGVHSPVGELVHDDPLLEEGRRAFDAWLA